MNLKTAYGDFSILIGALIGVGLLVSIIYIMGYVWKEMS